MAHSSAKSYDRIVRTVCSPNCMGTCGVNAFVRNDRIVKLEPASFPDPGYERICARGIAMAIERIHHPDRLTHPLIREGERGENRWRKVSWDEAYTYIVERLTRIAKEDGWRSNSWIYMSGNYGIRSSTSAARISNLLGGSLFSVGGLSSDGALAFGLLPITGAALGSNDISEIGGARYLLSAGKNFVDTGHSEMHFIFDAMENGLKFTMIDPRFSRSAAKADSWLAPRPGTDIALALGMINVIINEGLMKSDYVLRHTNAPFLVEPDTLTCVRERDIVPGGSDAYMVWDEAIGQPVRAEMVQHPALRGRWDVQSARGDRIACATSFELSWEEWQAFTPAHASSICDVPASEIRRIAIEYATIEPACIHIGYGIGRYANGHTAVRAWTTLATLCGNIGKPHAGVSTADGAMAAINIGAPDSWMMPGGKKGHSLSGSRMLEPIVSGDPYPVRSLWMVAYNFGTQGPLFKRFIAEALPKLDLFVVNEQVMTKTAEYADVVLPCVSYYEDDWDLVGNHENWFVQLRRRAVPPVGESRSDFDIFAGLCDRLGCGKTWRVDPEQACKDILASSKDPRIRAVDWETLRRDGVARVPIERPHTPFRDMRFNTPSGRIEIFQEQFADLGEAILRHAEPFEGGRSVNPRRYPLNLVTYKHLHSTHSQHTILPSIREMLPEPLLELSPVDADARGIADGDLVEVFNERGAFQLRAAVSPSARPGLLCMPEGFWEKHFVAGHPSDLGDIPENPVQSRVVETNWAAWDVACDVRRISNHTSKHSSTRLGSNSAERDGV